MATFVFSGRLVSDEGKPVQDAEIAIKVFSLERSGWHPVATPLPDDAGRFEEKVDISDLAPESTVPLVGIDINGEPTATAPEIKLAGDRNEFNLSFGDIVVAPPGGVPAVLQHVGIDALITDLGSKLGTVNKTLGEEASNGIRLGNVKVQVRGVVGNDGLGIALNSHQATAAAGSTLEFEYTQDTDSDTTEVTRVVPPLTGMTVTLARKILAAVGLRLNHSTKTATSDEIIGQCVLQSPPAETKVPLGTEVLAVFATVADKNGGTS